MIIHSVDILEGKNKLDVFHMWNTEYPANLNYSSIEEFDHYLSSMEDQEHYLIFHADKLVGWLFLFIRDQQRWFAMIVNTKNSRKGYGSRLLSIAKSKHNELHGWVIDSDGYVRGDGRPYYSPLRFYIKNGFKVIVQVRLELPHIAAIKIYWQKHFLTNI